MPMQRLKPLLASIILLWLAAACGQKGPLYLPEQEEPVAGSATESEDEEQKEPNEENP